MTTVITENATRTDGPHRPCTVRLALHDAMRSALKKPGAKLKITELTIGGAPVTARNLQITLAQIIPKGWRTYSKRDGEFGLIIWRLS